MDRFLKPNYWINAARKKLVPDNDYFKLLDIIGIFGGIIFNPTNQIERILWRLNRFLIVYQYCYTIFILLATTKDENFLMVFIIRTIMLMTFTRCLISNVQWRYHIAAITETRSFINGRRSHSGDQAFDDRIRSSFQKSSHIVFLAVLAMSIGDQIVLFLPNSYQDLVLGYYDLTILFGSNTARLLQSGMTFMHTIIWISMYFSCTVAFTTLLTGLRTELEIIAHGFEEIHSRVMADLRPKESHSAVIAPEEISQFLKYFKNHLQPLVNHQMEVTRAFQNLQQPISNIFFVVYYNDVIVIGSLMFSIVTIGMSPLSWIFSSASLAFLMECYWWCSVVDSFNDVYENIALHSFELCAKLPFDESCRKDYIKLRSSLRIIHQQAFSETVLSCGGVFRINTGVFVELVNFTYSMLTFLLNMQ
ncbi:uncharacterized protein LOC129742257 [Uranotaenia lowii]|uniref:uncharacterized protein LOC129742257 n=1 Tax=Uranotaenia lowii TaxID=190385 RepID=UPI002479184B|nr:uncharacterized protein LOC129742257 [Uranotaenia lowii]